MSDVKKSMYRSADVLSAQLGELHQRRRASQAVAQFRQQRLRRAQGAAGSQNVINEQNSCALGQVGGHLNRGLAIFKGVRHGRRGSGELTRLTDGNHAGVRRGGNGTGKQEPPRLDPGHDVKRSRKWLNQCVDA